MIDGADCVLELYEDDDEDMESSDCPAPAPASVKRKRVTKKRSCDTQPSAVAETLDIMKNVMGDLSRKETLPYAVYVMVQECFKNIPIERQMHVMGKIVNILSNEMNPTKDKIQESD